MRTIKYITFVVILVLMLQSFSQPPSSMRVEGGKRIGLSVDSLIFKADSTRRDSIILAKFISDSIAKDSIARAEFVSDSLRKFDRFSFTQDTIKPGNFLLVSFVPGLGQIYNNEYWKTPTFLGMIGGFAAGGMVFENNYNQTRTQWQNALNTGASDDVVASLQRKMNNQQSASTIFYLMSGVTYLYSVADATFNYRGNMSHIRKATTLSALFPGAGFFYTRTYWRIPIYYGAFAVMGSVIDYNNRYYQRFKTAYDLVADDNPDTVDEFGGRFSEDVLQNARDAYRRNRDFGIIATVGIYILSIIDTYVISTLKNWDISPDLTITPTLFNGEIYGASPSLPTGAGLSLNIRF